MGLILQAVANVVFGAIIVVIVWRSRRRGNLVWTLLLWTVGVLGLATGTAALVLVYLDQLPLGP